MRLVKMRLTTKQGEILMMKKSVWQAGSRVCTCGYKQSYINKRIWKFGPKFFVVYSGKKSNICVAKEKSGRQCNNKCVQVYVDAREHSLPHL